MRLPSSISPPVGRFADALLAIDLPDLDPRRRATTITFIEGRVTVLPSFTRFGVVVISFTLDAISRIVGLDRADRRRRREAAPPPRRVSPPHPLARLRVHLGDVARPTDDAPERRHDPHRGAGYDCDVLIVGSGAGGATTAAILAEAGLDVIVVEEGPWVEQGSVVPFSLEQMDRQYRSGGVTVALGLPSIAYTEGRCAGGGTEVNSGLYRRPPAETLDRWRSEYGIADFATDDIEAICDEVEQRAQRAAGSRRTHGAEREAATRCRAPRLAARRDPAVDDVPRAGQRRRRSSPEHDRARTSPAPVGRSTDARRVIVSIAC